jgi:magnesium-transporting ATPase (P-type)
VNEALLPHGAQAVLTETGLTEGEARRRLAQAGPNVLPAARPRNVLAIALQVVREPMLVLLLAGGRSILPWAIHRKR